ncbi:MAG: hypothetical protein R3273_06565 [Pseudidiomarina maritima]|nr:hypothetical protein [Pseudidiomarina maritima]
MKKLIPLLFLTPGFAFAQTVERIPDIVKLVGPYEITTAQAQSSVVHLYLPYSSVGVVGLSGGDTFIEAEENINNFDLEISKDKKSVFIYNSLSAGTSTTFVVTTACSISISVHLHSIKTDDPEKEVKPKLSLVSSPCGKGG